MTAPNSRPLILKSFPPITEVTLALYAAASGDINLPHIDSASARAAGFEDMFAQGMLVMAYMGRAVSEVLPHEGIRSFSTRFLAITPLGAELTCRGDIVDTFEVGGEQRVRLDLIMRDQHGETLLQGTAIAAARSVPQSSTTQELSVA